jgi:membrane protein
MNTDPDSRRLRLLVPASCRYLVTAIWRRFQDGRCAQVAGSLAFTTLLSLVPFVTLVAVVFSKFPESERFSDALRSFLLNNLLPEKAGSVIATYALQFSQKAANLTIVGGVVLIVTAIMLMRTIDQVINQIWMVRSRHPWATRLASYWLALTFGPLLLAGGVFVASATLSMSMDMMNEPAWLEVAGFRLISVVMLTGVFATLYYAVPHCSVRPGDAALAGLFAAAGFLVMQRLFGLYLAHFPSYTLVYGAFAVVPIFLLWLYFSWIVILLGAVVAAVLPERSLRRRPLPAFPGRTLYIALLSLAELAGAQREGGGRRVEVLAELACVGHDEVRDVLGTLEAARIAVRRDQGDWLLARAAEGLLVTEVGRLFGWALPPVLSGEPDCLEACVRAQWAEILEGMDSVAAIPVSRLGAAYRG